RGRASATGRLHGLDPEDQRPVLDQRSRRGEDDTPGAEEDRVSRLRRRADQASTLEVEELADGHPSRREPRLERKANVQQLAAKILVLLRSRLGRLTQASSEGAGRLRRAPARARGAAPPRREKLQALYRGASARFRAQSPAGVKERPSRARN